MRAYGGDGVGICAAIARGVIGDEGIDYDSAALQVGSVRPAAASRHATVQFNSGMDGSVVIAAASAEPIAGGSAPVLLLDFERRGAGKIVAPRVRSASVDERVMR